MSRAFVNEDAGGAAPRRGYGLPSRDDPGFDAAAAEALLEAARTGETESAEAATGYYWGEPRLREQVWRVGHALHAAGNHDLRAARAHQIGRQHRRFHAGATHLVDGRGTTRVR